MTYIHGAYGQFDKSIGLVPVATDTIPVYVGVAPVNLARGYKGLGVVNAPMRLLNMGAVQANFGYSDDWTKFTLCEAFKIHFANDIQNVGPVVAINILDPETHKKTEATTQPLTFVNGRATITSDTIILDTLVLAGKVEGTDFSIDYDFTKGQVIIDSLGDDITGEVNATFNEVDPSKITIEDIIGGVTASGVYTGLGCVGLVYPQLGLIPNIICCPSYSHNIDVYKAMLQAGTNINGHWDAVINVDLDINGTDTIAKAIKKKDDSDYSSERAKVYWPMWQLKDGTVYHLSSIATWLMCQVDGTHKGVPMESPSNKEIPAGRQYFGADSTNKGYDQQTSNQLNEAGITTGIYWAGKNVLWGPHTAAYRYGLVDDGRTIFDVSIRMMMHITNDFQREHADKIDSPMTKALADSIRIREQEKLDAYVAQGALIGEPVIEFKDSENPSTQLMEGDFVWNIKQTPTPPFKSGTVKVAYTDAGFSVYRKED